MSDIALPGSIEPARRGPNMDKGFSERGIMELPSKWQHVIEKKRCMFEFNRIILTMLKKAFNFMQK